MYEGLIIKCVPYESLTLHELYEVLRLRHLVFVLEQKCLFMDMDRYDQKAHHVMIFDADHRLLACTRLFDQNSPYPGYLSIGRVVTHPDVRNKKIGYKLMEISLQKIRQFFGDHPIKIGAQAYLKGFYGSFGFLDIGEYYYEDGIPHLKMVLNGHKP